MAVVAIDLAECINCGWCRRVCPVDCIHPDEHTVPDDKLEQAKERARAYAANQRQVRLNREAVVRRTLAKLAGSGAHA